MPQYGNSRVASIIALSLCACATAGTPPAGTSMPTIDTPRMLSEVSGEGIPLVVVGGGLTGWSSWKPLLPRLTPGRTVVLLQPLNVQYGLESRPLPETYSVRMEGGALKAALDSLGVNTPVDLLAWSYGALATLDFALQNPERVRSVVLIEPPALWVLPNHGRAHQEVARLEKLFSDPAQDVTEQMLESFLEIAGFVPPGANARQLAQWPAWIGFRRSLRNTPALFAHIDDLARVRKFNPPVLLATGTGTSPFLRHIIDTLAASFPHAKVVEMPAGHAPHLVSTDRFFGELRAFLETAPKS
jgi:pimeloyl-ACP methyl ester carboxylesterase